jgi:transcriptional regulator with GAF, ATPase, and Fis domain
MTTRLQVRDVLRCARGNISVDVRFIAATHPDLSLVIRNQQFPEDLFYRLNVFLIEIPPARE